MEVEAAKWRFFPFLLLSDLFQTLISSVEQTPMFWLTQQPQSQRPGSQWPTSEQGKDAQEEGVFKVDVLAIATEDCFLLRMVID